MKRIYTLAALLLLFFSLSAQPGRKLFVLHTSDTHSRIEPFGEQAVVENAGRAGVVRRATFVRQYRTAHPSVLLFDCGDISQGTPYYNLFQGELEVKMMNLMKYDAMTIGNHEFDFGLDNMARLFRMARFPVVCANYDVKGTVLEGLVKPYTVVERDGMRIGVFGLSPRLEGLVQTAKCQGIVFLDPIETARGVVERLRTAEKCDVVICLSHLGFQGGTYCDERLAAETSGIDLILGGHSHTFMKEPAHYLNAEGTGVSVLHSGKNGLQVGELVLTLTEK